MKEENNTDKVFREKLEGFNAEPPAYLWDGIQGQLAANRRKKRMAFYSWASVAALLILAFVAGWYVNDNLIADRQQPVEINSRINPIVVPQDLNSEMLALEEQRADENSEAPEQLAEAILVQTTSGDGISDKNDKYEQEPGSAFFADVAAAGMKKLERIGIDFQKTFTSATLAKKQDATNRKYSISDAERNLLAENANLHKVAASKEESGWKMGVNISPGYSSYSSSHSENYAQNMTYPADDGSGNVGGGFSVQYKAASRWRVESGVYYAKSGQKSSNSLELFALKQNAQMDYSAAPERAYLNTTVSMSENTMAMNSTAGIIEFNGVPKGAEIVASPEAYGSFSNALLNNGEFSQVFDFIEIPLYLRYLVVDSQFDLELLGGINAGVVVGNNAYMENEYGLQNIGKTKDVSAMNWSGTVGVGMNYALGKHISLAVEPRFNYYLNSINHNPEVEFRPYRVAVYTGLYYEF